MLLVERHLVDRFEVQARTDVLLAQARHELVAVLDEDREEVRAWRCGYGGAAGRQRPGTSARPRRCCSAAYLRRAMRPSRCRS